jgi:hypothetical protein
MERFDLRIEIAIGNGIGIDGLNGRERGVSSATHWVFNECNGLMA